jgi:iron complex transport system ATP-binding protein
MADLLAVKQLSFAYTAERVIDDVSFSMAEGEVVGLLGPNGSGKSTLIRLLGGLLRSRGAVFWYGRDIRDWPRTELARRIAYMPQSPTIDPAHTVMECLRLGRIPYLGLFGMESAADLQAITQAAETLGLTGWMNRRIGTLSGGQQQRVMLGKCMVQRPSVLLLDEPGTFLDLKHQAELITLLKQLARERRLTVLIAMHDLNLALACADRVILLNLGRIAADGPPDVAITEALLSSVYGIAMRRIDLPGGRPLFIPEQFTGNIASDQPHPLP